MGETVIPERIELQRPEHDEIATAKAKCGRNLSRSGGGVGDVREAVDSQVEVVSRARQQRDAGFVRPVRGVVEFQRGGFAPPPFRRSNRYCPPTRAGTASSPPRVKRWDGCDVLGVSFYPHLISYASMES